MADSALFAKFGNLIPSGEIIFKEGDDGDKMYIIQKGEVHITKKINNRDHIMAVLGRGDFFGETAIVTKSKRTATVTTVSEVELLAFDREGFAGMIEKNSKIALNIIDKLCRRLQNANHQIQHLVKKDEKGLISLNLLLRFKSLGSDKNFLEYNKTIEEISLNLEIPLESVQKIIDGLIKDTVFSLTANALTLTDKNKLESLI